MNMPVIGALIEFLRQLGTRWMDGKLAEADARIEVARIRAEAAARIRVSQAEADIQWDQIMAEGSRTSWKDEFWTIILAVPVVLAFIPGAEPFVEHGFSVLSEDVPEWYLYALGTAIAAAFGVRGLSTLVGRSGQQTPPQQQ